MEDLLVRNRREVPAFILNIMIVLFVGIGTKMMFRSTGLNAAFSAPGFENFKFFTVLSNEFCGILAGIWLLFKLLRRRFPAVLKLVSASAVGLTFLIIAAFLGPLYPDLNLYEGGNLYFHLIVPLIAMAEFILMETKAKIPFKYTLVAASLSLVYGMVYLFNNIINGIGEWPETNDWYGFLNWGYPVGIGIFAGVVLMNWGIAVLLRALNRLVEIGVDRCGKQGRGGRKHE